MIKKIFLSGLVLVMVTAVFGQQESIVPIVKQAAFFDKTPPLKEMPMFLPAKGVSNWEDGEVKNETVNMDFSSNYEGVVTEESSVQKVNGGKSTKGPIINIDGTGNVNGVYPPDTDGDVSNDHYVQMINLSYAVYDKNGTKLYGPVANSTLWSGFPGPWSGTNDGDPIILYDDLADRWVASQFAVYTSNNKYYELIAVSETSDPLGSWYRYAFEFDLFPDYPKLSVWSDGYYATFHMFNSSLQFQGMAAVAFEREKMLAGDPSAQMIYFGEYGSRFGYLPADVDGDAPPAGAPCNFVGMNFFGNQNMEVWRFEADWTNTSNSAFMLDEILSPDAFNANISGIPQPGTGTQLDAFSNVMMYRLPYRNFGTHQSIAATHTIRVGNTASIRWYELRNDGTDWSIYQQGTYSPDNNHRWLGSIALGHDGSIAVGYSVSSTSVYPSLRYAGRTANAPLGTFDIAEVEIVEGLGSQSGISRWGDYASMTVDPSEDGVFWFTSEYMKSNGWGTRIVSFDFEDLQPPVAFAGDDVSICENTLFEASATGQYYSSVEWTTSGDGFFQNANILNAKYLRGDGDIANGGVTLTLKLIGYQVGWEDEDEIYVTIVKEPEADAGEDASVATGNTYTLQGEAEDYSSVEWSTSGDGSFDDPSNLNAIYTPGTNDVADGSVDLTLTAFANEPCEETDEDAMTLSIGVTTNLSEKGIDQIKIYPNPSTGIFYLSNSSVAIDEMEILVTDLQGRVVWKKETSEAFQSGIDLSNQKKGIYLLKITANDFESVQRIIKK